MCYCSNFKILIDMQVSWRTSLKKLFLVRSYFSGVPLDLGCCSTPFLPHIMESCAPGLTRWNFLFSFYRKIIPSCFLYHARQFASPRLQAEGLQQDMEKCVSLPLFLYPLFLSRKSFPFIKNCGIHSIIGKKLIRVT